MPVKDAAYWYSSRGVVPSRQTVVVLHFGQTRSPGQELMNGLWHMRQRRDLAP